MQKVVHASGILCEDLFVPSDLPDAHIHLRHKWSSSQLRQDRRRGAVVFVHGATYGGIAAYDTPLPGGSWLDFVADSGWDAYAVDIRGYGRSSHPAPARAGLLPQRPFARTVEAIVDLSTAIDFIQARTGADQVDLVGWSWGTTICGGYAAQHPDRIGRVVLYAPLWILRDLSRAALPQALLPLAWLPHLGPLYAAGLAAFRHVSFDDVRRRWFRGLDDHTAASICPRDMLLAWWEHTLTAEASGASVDEVRSGLRAPNGVVADLLEYWAAGLPTYDPTQIKAPVLAVLGEWDVETPLYMAQELFSRLTAAPYKRLEVLARGTHAMSLEVNRFDLYRRVQQFLESDLELTG